MKLVHHSAAEITEILPIDVTPRGKAAYKPNGFWISTDGADSWQQWCLAEDFCLSKLSHIHDVTLRRDSRVLHLRTGDELLAFTRKYAYPLIPGISSYKAINWRRVAETYQGLLIVPYIWECRMPEETFWYYGWDCASGVIWDVQAIESITLREVINFAALKQEETSE